MRKLRGRPRPPCGGRAARAKVRPGCPLERVLPGSPPALGSEASQNPAGPHPTTKILLVWIGGGPANVLQAMKKGDMPAANHNPKFKVELPAIAAGTRANAGILLEFLKKP